MNDLLGLFEPVVSTINAKLVAALVIATVAGLVRGFSGFGSALIYIPLIGAVFDPKISAASLLLIDCVSGIPFAARASPHCRWFEIVPLTIAATAGVPIGALALLHTNAIPMRWMVSSVVFLMLAAIVSGWRYRGRPEWWITWSTGLLSGFCGGAFQMDGPPVVIFWLGGEHTAKIVRANLMMFIAVNGLVMIFVYWLSGLLTKNALMTSAVLGIPFIVAMTIGSRMFGGTSEPAYRWIAYVIIAAAALVSLPVFDAYLR